MKTKLVLLSLALAAITTSAAPSILRKNGDGKLQVTDNSFDDSKVVKVGLNNADVEISCAFRGGDFFGDFTLFSNPTIKNKSGKKLDIAYQAAFFDKSGELIACTTQSGEVEADGGDMQFGSCMSKLPQAEFAKITSYRVTVYVSVAKAKK